MNRLHGLYAITDAEENDSEKICRDVEAALRGGARLVQYRDKSTDNARREQTARALLALARQYEALLIINDDARLAAKIAADGVHLGQDDMPLREARTLLGPAAVVGVSCYNQLPLAQQAAAAGADYVAFGRFFASRTKPHAVQAELELLRRAKRELDIPVVAIGGITLANARELIAAGADMLAVMDGLFGQPDIAATARRFQALFTPLPQQRHG
jgi:thiamine-phosphate pyrophosphorylase